MYDRFLIRRAVSQVSGQGLMELLASGGSGASPQLVALGRPGMQDNSNGQAHAPESEQPSNKPLLCDPVYAELRDRAVKEVEVPARVLQLLIDLRTHMQSEREPGTYISDRRLVKAVALLQVAALTCGRTRVLEFDTLLLRNVLCYRPEDDHHITAWLLDHIAAEAGLRQPQFLLKALFGRACAAAVTGKHDVDLEEEVTALRNVLLRKLTGRDLNLRPACSFREHNSMRKIVRLITRKSQSSTHKWFHLCASTQTS